MYAKPLYVWISRKRALMRFKKKYNESISGEMPQEQFEAKSKEFERMLRTGKFIYVQRGFQSQIKIQDVKSQRHSDYIIELTITGKDISRSWKGKGAFMLNQSRPFFWMLKFYNNYQKAGQTGEWTVLVYECDHFQEHQCDGRWFYENKEDSYDYSGTWSLHDQ